jgi:hypothetical protein
VVSREREWKDGGLKDGEGMGFERESLWDGGLRGESVICSMLFVCGPKTKKYTMRFGFVGQNGKKSSALFLIFIKPKDSICEKRYLYPPLTIAFAKKRYYCEPK